MNVLLTGSTGYIGRRLKQRLLNDENINLKLLVRNKKSISDTIKDRIEIIEGDTFNKESLKLALKDVHTAYYLIHSLSNENYKDLDKISAQNFLDIAQECNVKRVIYLGGLGVKNDSTSTHLLSRIETGEILSSSNSVQTIWLRAGVIIGSGSASFEIIRNLTEKLPIMTTPRWVDTKAQPIAVEDVLEYLHSSLYLQESKNLMIDIGSEQLSYKEMMEKTAKALDLKRMLIPLPFMSINISSYWLNLFTPVPFSIAKALIEGLKSEVVIQNDNAKKYFPNIKPISYESAVKNAIKENRELITQILNQYGFKIFEASGGYEAVKIFESEKIDLIFMDILMSGLSGLETIEIIRKKDTKIPIITVSANVFNEDKQKAITSGANDFIPKPVEEKEILLKLEKYLNLQLVYENKEIVQEIDLKKELKGLPQEFFEKLNEKALLMNNDEIFKLLIEYNLSKELQNHIKSLVDEFRYSELVGLNS